MINHIANYGTPPHISNMKICGAQRPDGPKGIPSVISATAALCCLGIILPTHLSVVEHHQILQWIYIYIQIYSISSLYHLFYHQTLGESSIYIIIIIYIYTYRGQQYVLVESLHLAPASWGNAYSLCLRVKASQFCDVCHGIGRT